MDPILVGLMGTVGELEVGLVDQRGGGKRLAGSVSCELPVGPIVELAIDQGKRRSRAPRSPSRSAVSRAVMSPSTGM
jgi:hypothetical protein